MHTLWTRPGFAALSLATLIVATPATAQIPEAIEGLEWREVGPAVAGGRIADIAVHPTQRSTWYVAVGSGGLWKTEDGGTRWRPA